jgi:hypothetical protein
LSTTTQRFESRNIIAEFRGQAVQIHTWIFFFLPGILLVFASYLIGIYLGVTAYQQYGQAMAEARAAPWIILGTCTLLVLIVVGLYRALIALQRIRVYEEGILIRNFFLQKRSFLWMQISGISSSATRLTLLGRVIRTTPDSKIFPKDGKPISISRHIQGVPKFIEISKSKLYPLLWRRMKSAFLAGNTLQFGPLKVQKDSIEIKGRPHPWDSITRLYTQDGYLVVEFHDQSNRKLPVLDIPNLELLMQTVDWGTR